MTAPTRPPAPASRMGTSASGRHAFAVLLAVALVLAAADSRGAAFDYLYIVSNEGGSSGGHTAIRFGDQVYHFQNRNGLLVLLRDRASQFFYDYALLDNRAVHASRVEVSDATRAELSRRFRRRLQAQEAQLHIARALERDRKLIEFFLQRAGNPDAPAPDSLLGVPGLAYFDLDAGARDPALEELRRSVARELGPEFLAERRRALLQALERVAAEEAPDRALAPPSAPDEHPPFLVTPSERWFALRTAVAALAVLDAAAPLEPALVHPAQDDTLRMSADETRALRELTSQLRERLVRGITSPAPDWGRPFLATAARWLALRRSIESGHLVVLDTLGGADDGATRLVPPPRSGIAAELLEEHRTRLAGSRAHLARMGVPNELAWERVEENANRYLELLGALERDEPLRVERRHLLPERSSPLPLAYTPLPEIAASERGQLATRVLRARARSHTYARGLQHLLRYELVTRNCVTEIFETLNLPFDGAPRLPEERLGGRIEGPPSLAFIPFVSAHQVDERYRVDARSTTLSYRQSRLREMRRSEGTLRVALRESSPWTARSLRGHPDDSFFVFFTDEWPLLRPVFGSFNLVAGLGETTLGLLASPLDRGEMLLRGLRGAFVSVPELAFFNIRKGSNEWLPGDERAFETVDRPPGERAVLRADGAVASQAAPVPGARATAESR